MMARFGDYNIRPDQVQALGEVLPLYGGRWGFAVFLSGGNTLAPAFAAREEAARARMYLWLMAQPMAG
jgi:hypothetical protein